jgi:3-oxoacyl-[acyl-carrier protein] reductase
MLGILQGIGRASAVALAAQGYDIAVNFSSSTKDLDVTKDAIARLGKGTKVIGIQADLSVAGECTRVIDEVVEEFGKIDCLINNAYVLLAPLITLISMYEDINSAIALPRSIFDATADDVDKSHALNYRAPFLLTKAAISHIPKGGNIIFISSSLTGNSMVSYSASHPNPTSSTSELIC